MNEITITDQNTNAPIVIADRDNKDLWPKDIQHWPFIPEVNQPIQFTSPLNGTVTGIVTAVYSNGDLAFYPLDLGKERTATWDLSAKEWSNYFFNAAKEEEVSGALTIEYFNVVTEEVLRLLPLDTLDPSAVNFTKTHISSILGFFADHSSRDVIIYLHTMIRELNDGILAEGEEFVKKLREATKLNPTKDSIHSLVDVNKAREREN